MARAAPIPSTSSSSSNSGSDSDSETSTRRQLKRKFDTNSDSESDSSSSSSVSEPDSGSSSEGSSNTKELKKEASDSGKKGKNPRTKDVGEEEEEEEEEDDEEDVQVLSHKDQRKLKKKQKLLDSEPVAAADTPKSGKKSKANGAAKDEKPTRKNSVWVGNLSFRTTPDVLRTFFADAGEVTRVHMPTKAIHGTNVEGANRGENRGFAYVDFTTPEAKVIAITMSEKNLDGRRLLIKDGDDFSGRPAVASTPAATATDSGTSAAGPAPSAGLSKTAQKILARQKQPACPCLFLGNLGFEATQESVREMFERNAKSRDRWAQKDKIERAKGKGKKGTGKDADLEGEGEGEDVQDAGGEVAAGDGEERKGPGVRKVRLGTFEDSGNCKGFGFVDFATAAQATAALINPYNHSLDGRSLVVEYASFDAARRGGYRPPNPDGETGGRKSNHNAKGNNGGRIFKENRQNAGTRRESFSRSHSHKFDKVHENFGEAEADGDSRPSESEDRAYKKRKTGDDGHEHGHGDGDLERPAKRAHAANANFTRGPGEGWANAKHRRAKPGAALAMAQREKVAIVPSTGTRLTFV